MSTILTPNAIEYFTVNGKVYFIKNGAISPFDDVSCTDAHALRLELEKSPSVLRAIERMFPDDTVEQLRQFVKCRYGRLNDTPDFVNGRSNDCETPHPSCSEQCQFQCRICFVPVAKYGTPTQREMEIARLVNGNTNKEIANTLNISVNTVITHIAHLLDKIGEHSRSAIVSWNINNNIL